MSEAAFKQIVLASRPKEPPTSESFRLEEAPMPSMPPGGLLLRVLYFARSNAWPNVRSEILCETRRHRRGDGGCRRRPGNAGGPLRGSPHHLAVGAATRVSLTRPRPVGPSLSGNCANTISSWAGTATWSSEAIT
jgi:hypothetical protein